MDVDVAAFGLCRADDDRSGLVDFEDIALFRSCFVHAFAFARIFRNDIRPILRIAFDDFLKIGDDDWAIGTRARRHPAIGVGFTCASIAAKFTILTVGPFGATVAIGIATRLDLAPRTSLFALFACIGTRGNASTAIALFALSAIGRICPFGTAIAVRIFAFAPAIANAIFAPCRASIGTRRWRQRTLPTATNIVAFAVRDFCPFGAAVAIRIFAFAPAIAVAISATVNTSIRTRLRCSGFATTAALRIADLPRAAKRRRRPLQTAIAVVVLAKHIAYRPIACDFAIFRALADAFAPVALATVFAWRRLGPFETRIFVEIATNVFALRIATHFALLRAFIGTFFDWLVVAIVGIGVRWVRRVTSIGIARFVHIGIRHGAIFASIETKRYCAQNGKSTQ